MSITFSAGRNTPETLEVNVSNRNGFVILSELLDMGPSPEPWGDLDPTSMLAKLATAECRVFGIVRPTTDNNGERVELTTEGVSVVKTCRVIDFGITAEQVERYITRLRALAGWALENGEEVSYD